MKTATKQSIDKHQVTTIKNNLSILKNQLSIMEYNKEEKKNKLEICLAKLAAFNPTIFEQRGFSTRLIDESELWKFIDIFHDQRFSSNINFGLNSYLSREEFSQLQSYTQEILSFSSKFRSSATGRNALTRALIVPRILTNLQRTGAISSRKLNILELGPGCGYQSCMLAEMGHNIISMDCTQSLYIYQNRFYQHKKNINLIELASKEEPAVQDALNQIEESPVTNQIFHMPWWQFVNDSITFPKIDIIIANHMLSEMERYAMRYSIAKILTTNVDTHKVECPLIMAETFGGNFERIPEVMSDLINLNMIPIYCGNVYPYKNSPQHSNNFNFNIFAAKNSSYIPKPAQIAVDFYATTKSEECFKNSKTFQKSKSFLKTFLIEKNFDTGMHIYSNTNICESMLEMRNWSPEQKVYLEDIKTFYTGLRKSHPNLRSQFTEDELFYRSNGKIIETFCT